MKLTRTWIVNGTFNTFYADLNTSAQYHAKKGTVLVGFHERKSRYVADMQVCPILPEKVSALLMPLRELVGRMDARETLPQIEVDSETYEVRADGQVNRYQLFVERAVTLARYWAVAVATLAMLSADRSEARASASRARISGSSKRVSG